MRVDILISRVGEDETTTNQATRHRKLFPGEWISMLPALLGYYYSLLFIILVVDNYYCVILKKEIGLTEESFPCYSGRK